MTNEEVSPAEGCPQGTECPVHFRVDEAYFVEDADYARMINYMGDYVVITEDNPEISNPALMIKAVLGQLTTLPPRWATMIFYVGSGVVADLTDLAPKEAREARRHIRLHDSWESIRDEHNVTVTALECGFIDVSKPLEG